LCGKESLDSRLRWNNKEVWDEGGEKYTLGCHSHESGNLVKQCNFNKIPCQARDDTY